MMFMNKLQLNIPVLLALLTVVSLTPHTTLAVSRTNIPAQGTAAGKNSSEAKIVSGRITGINGSIMTVKSRNGISYKVNTDSSTEFSQEFGGASTLEGFGVNDAVLVNGQVSNNVIQAAAVHGTSISKAKGLRSKITTKNKLPPIKKNKITGVVVEKNADKLVLKTVRDGNFIVAISGADLINRENATIDYNKIQTGDNIRLDGMINKTNKQITSVTTIRDLMVK